MGGGGADGLYGSKYVEGVLAGGSHPGPAMSQPTFNSLLLFVSCLVYLFREPTRLPELHAHPWNLPRQQLMQHDAVGKDV